MKVTAGSKDIAVVEVVLKSNHLHGLWRLIPCYKKTYLDSLGTVDAYKRVPTSCSGTLEVYSTKPISSYAIPCFRH